MTALAPIRTSATLATQGQMSVLGAIVWIAWSVVIMTAAVRARV